MVSVSAAQGNTSFNFTIPDGWQAGDVATMSWRFARPHTGWIFLEKIPHGTGPGYSVSGTGSGDHCNNRNPDIAAKAADFSGTSGTSQLHMQEPGVVGASYSIKLYLCDNDYGGDAETTFVCPPPAPVQVATATVLPPPAPVTPPVATLPAATVTAGGGFTYTPPNPEPAAIDGARLSQQGLDVQDFYVSNFGPGILAATQFVIDHNQQLAALGATTGNPTPAAPPAGTTLATLPAGVSGMGNDVGLIGGGGNFSSTPSVLDQRQTGAAPPSVSGSPLSQSVAGIPVWAIAAAAAVFLLSNRR